MFNFFMTRLQYNQQTWRFFVTIAALGFAIDGVYAVLLNLYLLRLGYGAEFIGQVNGLALVTFAIMGLPAGILGARWTSRQMLRVGLGVALIGAALLPLAEFTPTGWQGNWLIVTYALILVGFALYFVNGAPFLMAAVTQEKQNSAFALQSAILSLSAFIGSMLGGTLPELISRFSIFTLNDPQPYRFTLMIVGIVVFAAFTGESAATTAATISSEENGQKTPALVALSGGYILTRYGFRDLFLLGALFTFIGTVLFWMHLRMGKARKPQFV